MSFWATAMVAANSAVATPMMAISVDAHGDAYPISGLTRTIRNTPPVTIVAAWISADTGVGPAIASGSHRYSGSWALLPQAPTNSISHDRRRRGARRTSPESAASLIAVVARACRRA